MTTAAGARDSSSAVQPESTKLQKMLDLEHKRKVGDDHHSFWESLKFWPWLTLYASSRWSVYTAPRPLSRSPHHQPRRSHPLTLLTNPKEGKLHPEQNPPRGQQRVAEASRVPASLS